MNLSFKAESDVKAEEYAATRTQEFTEEVVHDFQAGASWGAFESGVVRELYKMLKRECLELEEGGARVVEDGFEEPSCCERFRKITNALAAYEAARAEMEGE